MKLQIKYFAQLREGAQTSQEEIDFSGRTIADLWNVLKEKYNFDIAENDLKVAVNDEYSSFSTSLQEKDTVVFIPPIAGG